MNNFIAVSFAIVSLILSTAIAGHVHADVIMPNVPVIFTVYASAHRDTFGGIITAFFIGFLAGVLVGDGRGILMLTLLTVVGMTRLFRTRVPLERTLAGAGFCVIASLVADSLFAGLTLVLEPGVAVARPLLSIAPKSALVSGVLAIPIYAILSRIEPFLHERQERARLFH